MKRMRDEFGATFVFSTHDPRIMDQAEVTFHLIIAESLPNTTTTEQAMSRASWKTSKELEKKAERDERIHFCRKFDEAV